jgi:hypothetical protein
LRKWWAPAPAPMVCCIRSLKTSRWQIYRKNIFFKN